MGLSQDSQTIIQPSSWPTFLTEELSGPLPPRRDATLYHRDGRDRTSTRALGRLTRRTGISGKCSSLYPTFHRKWRSCDHWILLMCSAIEVLTFRTLPRILLRAWSHYSGFQEAPGPGRHTFLQLQQGNSTLVTHEIIFWVAPCAWV